MMILLHTIVLGPSRDGDKQGLQTGTTRSPMCSAKPPRKPSSAPQKGKAVLLQPRWQSDGLTHRASYHRAADVWILHEKHMTLKPGISR